MFTDAWHSPDVEMKIWFMQSKRITLQYSFTYGYQVKFTLDAHFLQVVPGWCTMFILTLLCHFTQLYLTIKRDPYSSQ